MTGRSGPGDDGSRDRRIGRAFVGAQIVLVGGLVLLPGADHYPVPPWLRSGADVTFWIGVLLAVVAAAFLGRSLTATPIPTEHATLRTSGPYRWVRHPIYTGVVCVVAAIAVRSGNLFALAVGAVTIAFFHVKSFWEEQRLTERFTGYAEYAAATPRFLPSPFRAAPRRRPPRR